MTDNSSMLYPGAHRISSHIQQSIIRGDATHSLAISGMIFWEAGEVPHSRPGEETSPAEQHDSKQAEKSIPG